MRIHGWLNGAALGARLLAAAALLAAASAAAPALAAERFERGLLWRVEGKGAPASHVFGTIHLADPRVAAPPPAAERELRQARSLTLEVSLDPGNVLALAGRMIYADGRDLAGVAGEELFAKAAAVTAALGLPEPLLRVFKPWAVALMLSAPQQDPSMVLDGVLARLAAEQGKPVLELETLDEQVGVFEGMREADQVVLLRQAVDSYERMPQVIGQLVDAYVERDLAALARISSESGGDGPDAQRLRDVLAPRLLLERNVRMAQRSEARLREGGAFIAVGALHLYGRDGILSLLEKRGWRVTLVY